MALFTRDELIIIRVVVFELLHDRVFFLYPEDTGMKVDEFIEENRLKFRNLIEDINRRLDLKISKAHEPALRTAIRFYLEFTGRPEPVVGRNANISDRQQRLQAWFKTLAPGTDYMRRRNKGEVEPPEHDPDK